MLPSLFTCKLLIKSVHIWGVPSLCWWPSANLIENLILPQGQALNSYSSCSYCLFSLRQAWNSCIYFIIPSSDVIPQQCLLSDRMPCCDLMLPTPSLLCQQHAEDLVTNRTGQMIDLVGTWNIQNYFFTNTCILWEDF